MPAIAIIGASSLGLFVTGFVLPQHRGAYWFAAATCACVTWLLAHVEASR